MGLVELDTVIARQLVIINLFLASILLLLLQYAVARHSCFLLVVKQGFNAVDKS